MPDFTIRGNPDAIRARATTTSTKGQLFYDTGDALAKVSTEGWTGRAADHFRDAHDLEPARWIEAGNGFARAGNALNVYASAVETAQQVAEWAATEHARGDQVTAGARTAYDNDVARARQEQADAAAIGTIMTLTIIPFDDPGEEIRQHALGEFAAARSSLETAAQTCADEVRRGCDAAPEEPGWLESGFRFVGGVLEGAGEALWDLATLTPFSPVNMIRDLHSLVTGDLTPEELMAKYRLSLETAQGMLDALVEDPVGFGKELGKGLLDWDTWADDPARALGHLVPDAIAAAATAGTGAVATRGANAATDGLDALGDLGRLDDLGDLNRLDDLGDLGDLNRLDDLGDLGDLHRLDDPPTPAELDAINTYTGDSYRDINAYLRSGADSGTYSPAELARLSDDVSSGLTRLEPSPGLSTRGTDLPDSVLDSLQPGGTFRDDAFLSSSTDPQVAQDFMRNEGGNAMIHIDGQSGRDVASVSQYGNEAEILFDRGTQFQVVDKVWNPAGYWDIYLRE